MYIQKVESILRQKTLKTKVENEILQTNLKDRLKNIMKIQTKFVKAKEAESKKEERLGQFNLFDVARAANV